MDKDTPERRVWGEWRPKDRVTLRIKFSVVFWRIVFLKNREFVTEYYSFFRRLCRHLAIFRQKKSHCEGTLIYIYILGHDE